MNDVEEHKLCEGIGGANERNGYEMNTQWVEYQEKLQGRMKIEG